VARRGVRLTDAQWAKIEPLLPRMPRTARGGRPWVEARAVIDGILWVLKTGARWRDLPAEYPSPATCWRRLNRWFDDGTWERIWRAFLTELDQRGKLAWETAFIDGTFAPAKKGAPTSALPSAGKAQSAWYWWSVRVFLWEYASPRPRRPRSRSSTKRSPRG
jgi:transposase